MHRSAFQAIIGFTDDTFNDKLFCKLPTTATKFEYHESFHHHSVFFIYYLKCIHGRCMQFTWNHSHANVCTSVIQNLLSIFTLLHDWCELELSKMFQFHSTQFQIVASKYQKPNRPSEMFQCSEWLEKQRKVCGAHCSRQTSSFVFTLHSNHSFHYLSAFHLYLCMPKTMSLL